MNPYSPRRSRLSTKLLFGFLALTLPTTAPAAPKPERSRSFEGVTATFEIQNPVLKQREDLKVAVVYSNISNRTVNFRFLELIEDVEIYRKGEDKAIIGGFSGEPAIRAKTLKPGGTVRVEEIVPLRGWSDLRPGDYEIRFFYHLGVWHDEAIARKYLSHPHDEWVVPWNDRRYGFTLVANPEPPPPEQEIDLSDIPIAIVKEISPEQSPTPKPR